MINDLYIENFKCFNKIHIELSTLNVLAGINSMGKSTIIQSILLLRQAYDNNSLNKYLHLNGNLVNLGTGYDVLNRNSNSEKIEISIKYDHELFKWKYQYEQNSRILKLMDDSNILPDTLSNVNIFSNGFQYISADRIGPRRYYEIDDSGNNFSNIGYKGEFFPDCLEKIKHVNVKNDNLIHSSCKNRDIIYQFEAWMSELSPGINIDTKNFISEAGIVGIEYKVNGTECNPINVGFGLSYTAPIVLSLLKASAGDLIILENPEAHLHPRGQRILGELISRSCAGGVQIILETHSDHVLNGIRLSVKQKKLNKNDVRLNFFYQDRNRDEGIIKYCKSSPAILEDGSISSWPDVFFDEWYKALYELIDMDGRK